MMRSIAMNFGLRPPKLAFGLLGFLLSTAPMGLGGCGEYENGSGESEQADEPDFDEWEQGLQVSGWRFPLANLQAWGAQISQGYGGASGHTGVDVAVPVGTRVYAIANGTVVASTMNGGPGTGYGNVVIVRHTSPYCDGTWYSLYGHLSQRSVAVGAEVVAGQQIGLSGNTGMSTGPHLHLAIYRNFVQGSFPVGYTSNPAPNQHPSGFTDPTAFLNAHVAMRIPATPPQQGPRQGLALPNPARLTWGAVNWATAYAVEVRRQASPNVLLAGATVAGTAWTFNAPARTTYVWHVRALGCVGASAWSPDWTFVVNWL